MTTFTDRLRDLQARSAETDRQAAETAAQARRDCAEAVAAADRLLAAIEAAPAPEVLS